MKFSSSNLPPARHLVSAVLCVALIAMTMPACGPQDPNADVESPSLRLLSRSSDGDAVQTSSMLRVGVGQADITGPMVGLETMGYAAPARKTEGLQQRLWARSFVFEDEITGQRLGYSLIDTCFVTLAVKAAVVERLGSGWGHDNLMVTATHTHSGPGGFSAHGLYNQPSGGFSDENFDIIVSGIVASIRAAESSLAPGTLRLAEGAVAGVSRNRSLAAYLRNPAAERDTWGAATDESAALIRVDGPDGPLGLLHWLAVHATSVNKDNTLISGDNKGYAAWKIEQLMGADYRRHSGFVAAFANSNAGDASPNVAGDVDGDGDWECSANESFACARESGEKHVASALEMIERADVVLSPPLRAVHRFVDMSDVEIESSSGGAFETCTGAIGLSMLAGSSEDGPGVLREGISCSSGGPLARLRCAQRKFSCQGQKPVALETGSFGSPTWTPNVLPTQIFQIGPLALVALPAEFTTMAGRRLREHVKHALAPAGVEHVVLAGYANAYSNYVTTREEYQLQHYEGASTLFGEWTLSAYQKVYGELAKSLVSGVSGEMNPAPRVPEPAKRARSASGRVDRVPEGKSFGAVLRQPRASYRMTGEVRVAFQAAHLNSSLRRSEPFVEIQRQTQGGWVSVAYDWDFSTRLRWVDQGQSMSRVEIVWDPREASPGMHRILYRGWARGSDGGLQEFTGISRDFELVP
jgi:neutral ceramidase